jgi:hypothetical protein
MAMTPQKFGNYNIFTNFSFLTPIADFNFFFRRKYTTRLKRKMLAPVWWFCGPSKQQSCGAARRLYWRPTEVQLR